MEIRLNVDDSFMKELQNKLGQKKATQLTLDALTLLNWAASEVKDGRKILSASGSGEDIHALVMPSLQTVKK